MKEIIEFFKQHKGYARMEQLKHSGFHTRKIRKLIDSGKIQKIKPGLYRLTDMYSEGDYPISFIDVCKSLKNGIICLISALEYHELSTINPEIVYVAIPNSDKRTKIDYPPVKVFYFRKRFYELGIEEVETEIGSFKIYSAEKTICDMFRYRNKLGEDLALEGLKNYLKRKDRDINKLWNYAIKAKVKTIMHPYMKAMVIE